jgi:tripartite-type tricarboxylate transporter receptor subunit TctC
MRRLVGRVLPAVVLLLAGASRLIRAMIPYGAGSAADVVPRLVFDRLSAELGQAIVVENRPGAGAEVIQTSSAAASISISVRLRPRFISRFGTSGPAKYRTSNPFIASFRTSP